MHPKPASGSNRSRLRRLRQNNTCANCLSQKNAGPITGQDMSPKTNFVASRRRCSHMSWSGQPQYSRHCPTLKQWMKEVPCSTLHRFAHTPSPPLEAFLSHCIFSTCCLSPHLHRTFRGKKLRPASCWREEQRSELSTLRSSGRCRYLTSWRASSRPGSARSLPSPTHLPVEGEGQVARGWWLHVRADASKNQSLAFGGACITSTYMLALKRGLHCYVQTTYEYSNSTTTLRIVSKVCRPAHALNVRLDYWHIAHALNVRVDIWRIWYAATKTRKVTGWDSTGPKAQNTYQVR